MCLLLSYHINDNTQNATTCEQPSCPCKAWRNKKCDKSITGSIKMRNSKITFYNGLLYLLSNLQGLRHTYTITYAIMFDHLIHCDCQVTAVLEKALHIAFWLNSDVPWHSVYFAKATSLCKQLHSRPYFPNTHKAFSINNEWIHTICRDQQTLFYFTNKMKSMIHMAQVVLELSGYYVQY